MRPLTPGEQSDVERAISEVIGNHTDLYGPMGESDADLREELNRALARRGLTIVPLDIDNGSVVVREVIPGTGAPRRSDA